MATNEEIRELRDSGKGGTSFYLIKAVEKDGMFQQISAEGENGVSVTITMLPVSDLDFADGNHYMVLDAYDEGVFVNFYWRSRNLNLEGVASLDNIEITR